MQEFGGFRERLPEGSISATRSGRRQSSKRCSDVLSKAASTLAERHAHFLCHTLKFLIAAWSWKQEAYSTNTLQASSNKHCVVNVLHSKQN